MATLSSKLLVVRTSFPQRQSPDQREPGASSLQRSLHTHFLSLPYSLPVSSILISCLFHTHFLSLPLHQMPQVFLEHAGSFPSRPLYTLFLLLGKSSLKPWIPSSGFSCHVPPISLQGVISQRIPRTWTVSIGSCP